MTPSSQLRKFGAQSIDEIPGPGAQAQPSDARSPPAQGEWCPSHARYLQQARPGLTCRAEAPPPRPAPGEGAGPREGEGACLQTRGRARGEGARGAPAGTHGTLTPPAVAHPVPASLPRLRLRGLLLSGRRRRRGIQPGPPPPPPGRDPTMHLFPHPHRPTLPRGMSRREEGRTSRPRHDAGPEGGGSPTGARDARGAERGDSGSAAGDSGLRRRARLGSGVTAPGRPPSWCGREVSSRAPAPSPRWERRRRSPPARPSAPAPAVPSDDPGRAHARWGRGRAVRGAPPCW